MTSSVALTTLIESAKASLSQSQAHGAASSLRLSSNFADGQRLELNCLIGAEGQSADLQVEVHLLLLALNVFQDFVANKLKDSLDQVGSTADNLCNGREAG